METNLQPYIDKAIDEILHPQFDVTKQYLEVNEVEFENGLPKVEGVDINYTDSLVAVYFPFKGQRYFLQVNVRKEPAIEVHFVFTENGNQIYFTAVSETLTKEELSANFPFKPLTGWSKGDMRKYGKLPYNFSRISFEPFTSEACDLERQIDLLLTELEKNSERVRQLAQKSTAYISVCRHQYISGNAGVHFSVETMQRLVSLHLSVDIDTYIVGNAIKDEG